MGLGLVALAALGDHHEMILAWGSDIGQIQNVYKLDTFPGKYSKIRNLTKCRKSGCPDQS